MVPTTPSVVPIQDAKVWELETMVAICRQVTKVFVEKVAFVCLTSCPVSTVQRFLEPVMLRPPARLRQKSVSPDNAMEPSFRESPSSETQPAIVHRLLKII